MTIATVSRFASTALVATVLAGRLATAQDDSPRTGESLLREQCGACHLDGSREGGVSFDGVGTVSGPERAVLVAAWRNARAGTMPPPDQPPPDADDRRRLVHWLERDVFGIDPTRPDPGPAVVRRLNRVEYANSVADLTGLAVDLRDDLPADDTGYGFDTVGAVLALPPLLLERYLELAVRVGERVAAEARDPNMDPADVNRLLAAGPQPTDLAERPDHLRRTIARLATRGFRRAVDEATVDALTAIAIDAGALERSFPDGIAAAVTAILSSPRFLLRFDEGQGPAPGESRAAVEPIDEFSLASRLSYFLWSTMPDDTLLAHASAGTLRTALSAEVRRMIQDPRGTALAANFVGQWLQTRDVEAVPVSLKRVLDRDGADIKEQQEAFDERVRPAMRRETEMLFMHLLRQDAPPTDLLVGRSTFLNEDLAAFYEIAGVTGDAMRLVELPTTSDRGGVLSHGSVLVVTSTPTRTSPVKRGLFVIENLLGLPVPPPPPNVEPLDAAAEGDARKLTMRELLTRHRADPQCAACHSRMDPIGLALEDYDAIGRSRRGRSGTTLETAGQLVTGEHIGGTADLAAVIATTRRRDFHRCITEKMLTYALGRGLDVADSPAVDAIVARLEQGDGLAALVQAIVDSVPFQMRRRPAHPPAEPIATVSEVSP